MSCCIAGAMLPRATSSLCSKCFTARSTRSVCVSKRVMHIGSVLYCELPSVLQCVLQCVAVCCAALRLVFARNASMRALHTLCTSIPKCHAYRYSVAVCAAVYVAVCCNVCCAAPCLTFARNVALLAHVEAACAAVCVAAYAAVRCSACCSVLQCVLKRQGQYKL